MNVTLLKKTGSKEVINRVELADLAAAIKNGMIKDAVRKTRELYHLMNPHRQDDGQITSQLLANRYPNFDPETPFQKIGNALNNVQFNFKSKRKTNHMEYWLIEK